MRATFSRCWKTWRGPGTWPPYAMALVHAGLGDPEAVFEWLDRAYSARDVHLMFLTVGPKWDSYRLGSRFGALLDRCGFNLTASGTCH
jgi:hypothetical protein